MEYNSWVRIKFQVIIITSIINSHLRYSSLVPPSMSGGKGSVVPTGEELKRGKKKRQATCPRSWMMMGI